MTAPRRWALPASRGDLEALFGRSSPLVGMVHLAPLPGSPGWGGSMASVLDRARADAEILIDAGMDGLLVENFGDAPFAPGRAEPEVVAGLALAVAEVSRAAGRRPVGVNVLRNDARSAVGLAAATGAAFARVNVHAGVMFTDQGVLQGAASETLRVRRELAPDLLIWADVLVKHAVPPPGTEARDAAADLRERALADVLVVTGTRTGAAASADRIGSVREAAPDAPLWIGSGVTPENVSALLESADGVIVGSALQRGGRAGAGVEEARVRRLLRAAGR